MVAVVFIGPRKRGRSSWLPQWHALVSTLWYVSLDGADTAARRRDDTLGQMPVQSPACVSQPRFGDGPL